MQNQYGMILSQETAIPDSQELLLYVRFGLAGLIQNGIVLLKLNMRTHDITYNSYSTN